eukprot:TRINITY_DN1527_c2_g4_i1.p1 TRINITY_DN1527_c2_g4~~TRINITY_DN1527_c2_g4_i1.p1  ORF type:complete len:141 (-),score=24.54 TRINITY_DN1527_c2_g4_i1:144-566(-)
MSIFIGICFGGLSTVDGGMSGPRLYVAAVGMLGTALLRAGISTALLKAGQDCKLVETVEEFVSFLYITVVLLVVFEKCLGATQSKRGREAEAEVTDLDDASEDLDECLNERTFGEELLDSSDFENNSKIFRLIHDALHCC